MSARRIIRRRRLNVVVVRSPRNNSRIIGRCRGADTRLHMRLHIQPIIQAAALLQTVLVQEAARNGRVGGHLLDIAGTAAELRRSRIIHVSLQVVTGQAGPCGGSGEAHGAAHQALR